MSTELIENFSIAAAVHGKANNSLNNRKDKYCDHCNRVGHTIENCRTLKFHCKYCDNKGHTEGIGANTKIGHELLIMQKVKTISKVSNINNVDLEEMDAILFLLLMQWILRNLHMKNICKTQIPLFILPNQHLILLQINSNRLYKPYQ